MSILTVAVVVGAVVIGAIPTVQADGNAIIAQYGGRAVLAAISNTVVASLVLLAEVRVLNIHSPSVEARVSAPWWACVGGLCGAAMVSRTIVLAPKRGAASFVRATMVGAVAAFIVIDHFVLIGCIEHPAQPWRERGRRAPTAIGK